MTPLQGRKIRGSRGSPFGFAVKAHFRDGSSTVTLVPRPGSLSTPRP